MSFRQMVQPQTDRQAGTLGEPHDPDEMFQLTQLEGQGAGLVMAVRPKSA